MQTPLTQAAAEQAIHEALEASDERTLEAFADFASGEIDGETIAAILLAILRSDSRRFPFVLAAIRHVLPDLGDAIEKLENDLERKRAAFIEHHAAQIMRDEEARLDAAAELNQESRNAYR